MQRFGICQLTAFGEIYRIVLFINNDFKVKDRLLMSKFGAERWKTEMCISWSSNQIFQMKMLRKYVNTDTYQLNIGSDLQLDDAQGSLSQRSSYSPKQIHPEQNQRVCVHSARQITRFHS
jgi:hypothetical protein